MTEQKDLKINEAGASLTDNEIIAQFMGLPLTKKSLSFVNTGHDVEIPFMRWKYDQEWNWLMDVVEKIKNIDILVFNYDADRMSRFRQMRNHFLTLTITTPLKLVHLRAVEIIKLYNETQSGRG